MVMMIRCLFEIQITWTSASLILHVRERAPALDPAIKHRTLPEWLRWETKYSEAILNMNNGG